ncbi:MAG: V-type ATP synthase subunit B, partial [Planctomycetota bacterium]
MVRDLIRYSEVLEIVGDTLKVHVPDSTEEDVKVRYGDLAVVQTVDGASSLAQVIHIDRDKVSMQVFSGTKGVSTGATATFLGHPMQTPYSGNILGRVFDGAGVPVDGGPDLSSEPRYTIGGPSVNPTERIVPKRMIRTDVPMIDIFNSLV